jgi:hypothetical protein
MDKLLCDTKKIVLLIGCFAMLFTRAKGQDIGSIKRVFEKYNQTTLHEKIYMHTDRAFYLTGEILWFKLYTVDAGLNTPVNISKVAYVDVLDITNNSVLQAKIALQNGTGSGSLYIPVTLANGNYKLRAYTNWMKNFSPDLYFEKTLTIVNPLVTPDAPIKKSKIDYDIQFFPEGGNLVNGITSTVGFKATGEDGKGIDVDGVIINQSSDTVARFQTSKFGIGRFTFTPVANQVYKVVMRAGPGNALIKQLPAAVAQGFVMHVTDDGGKQLQVKITGSQPEDLYLLAHSGPHINLAQQVHPGAGNSATLLIDKAKLGEGINHLTLFNANRQPLAERLVFIRPAVLNLQASIAQQFGLRKKVVVDVASSGSDGKPQKTNLSLSVYRTDSLNGNRADDLVSYLWLSSELKGNIEMPGYYFNNVNADTDEELDNLLLTQGWSLFKWNDILNGKQPAFRFLPEYNGHLITGQITDRSGAKVNNTIVYLGVISKKVQLYGAHSGTSGQLIFNTRDLYGANEIVLQTNTAMDSTTYQITLNNPFSEQYATTKLQPLYFNKTISAQIESNSLAMQVQNLYRPERLRQFNTSGIDSLAFYDNQYKSFALDNFTRFTTTEEVLREYVTNVNVAKQNGHFHLKFINAEGYLSGDNDPLILLDGIPVFNTDKAFTIDPLKMKRLDVVNQRYFWGPIVSDGILSFTSYKTDFGGFELDPRAIVLDYEGMQLQREFYSPVYDTEDQLKSRIPDFRNLLYWAPDLNTGVDGKAKATFFTSDKPGKYIGVVQGMAANGQAGRQYFTFEVKK